jgi:hypothetical protein
MNSEIEGKDVLGEVCALLQASLVDDWVCQRE